MNPAEVIKAETGTGNVISSMSLMGHEELLFCNEPQTGLKAIIAVHNTTLGPALGGTRMWSYKSETDALEDVLRLSRGMTYKAAISGLNLGGGKAVIIGDARKDKSEAMLRRFGQFVNDLGGKYITAEDVGMTSRDMELIHMHTKHVSGLPEHLGGSGNPSPVTAYGVYMGMKASVHYQKGSDSLHGMRILVQGCGSVGQHLVEYLVKEGAHVLVTDIYEDKLKETVERYGATAVDPENFMDMDFDIYAPCALGGTLNDDSISRLKCSIVAGAANNQLKREDDHSQALLNKGILYAPDFLINAGGLINVYSEYIGNYKREVALQKTQHIYDVTLQILKKSNDEHITTLQAAKNIAEKRIADIANLRIPFNSHNA
jgi:leucine dehydrogenase